MPMLPEKRKLIPGLIVDDSDVQSFLLARDLCQLGVAAKIAGNLQEAEQIVRESIPELAFVELLMFRANGFQISRQLRGDYGIPCVLLTATARETDIEWATKMGIEVVLPRPYLLPDLERALDFFSTAETKP